LLNQKVLPVIKFFEFLFYKESQYTVVWNINREYTDTCSLTINTGYENQTSACRAMFWDPIISIT